MIHDSLRRKARARGISWEIDPPVFMIPSTGGYCYRVVGRFTRGARTVVRVGMASSRDFAIPLQALPRRAVREAAVAACFEHGLRALTRPPRRKENR